MTQLLEAVTWIGSLKKFGIKPGLERMHWVLEKLDHPERRLKFVHIAGTNGKGSTLQYIANVLRTAGYCVGTYISPAMGEITNRIQLNGDDVPDKAFAEIVMEIRGHASEIEDSEMGSLTEFEVTTLVAIIYFARMGFPDIVVWETGLGGRLDCTNVVYPLVSVITNIGYDHINILGDTLEQIAAEKAGIIKNGVPVVTAIETREAFSIIQEKAKTLKAPLYAMNDQYHYRRSTSFSSQKDTAIGERFEFYGLYRDYHDLRVPLMGEHQVKNAALAVMVLEILRQNYAIYFETEDLTRGLAEVRWPGRFEIKQINPWLILDGAHNIEGIDALTKTFIEQFPNRKMKLLFAALADKNVLGMVGRIAALCEEVIVTTVAHDRAQSSSDIEMWFRDMGANVVSIPDWSTALEYWLSHKRTDDVLVATGSLYFISDIRKVLGQAQASCSDFHGKG